MYKIIGVTVLSAALIATGILVFYDKKREGAAELVEQEWLARPIQKVVSFGSTKTLEVLPLVNWHTGKEGLKTEPGVSYLIKTDTATVLFDVGFNKKVESPSPLEYNMDRLGISLSDIDMVFLSHAHRDHVGGLAWEEAGSFSLGVEQVNLSGKRAISPIPFQYPDINVETYSQPVSLAPGLATTGPIARQLFIGRIEEQALVINLEGKGLVVIVGCGHQTLDKLLARIDESFDEPLYGILGDLHYPVPQGRLYIAGIDIQRRLASGNGLFDPLTMDGVTHDINTLKDREIGFISLGGHDTSDEVLSKFKNQFGPRFHRAKSGVNMTISSTE